MENIMTIQAEARTATGKKTAKSLRRQGMIPAVLYGESKDSINITVCLNDIKKILKSESGENTILRIMRGEKEQMEAMIKELQYNYLSDEIIHVDFVRINLNKSVEVLVPIILEGEPIGVKLEDGILDFVNREIKIKCLPNRIPREFRMNIADLHAGHSLKAEDIPLDADIQLLSHAHTVICAVVKHGVEVEEVKEVEEAAAPVEGEPGAVPEEEKDKEKKEKEKKEE